MLREYVNATPAEDAFFATRGRRSSRPDLTVPYPERSPFTSTKSVCLLYYGTLIERHDVIADDISHF